MAMVCVFGVCVCMCVLTKIYRYIIGIWDTKTSNISTEGIRSINILPSKETSLQKYRDFVLFCFLLKYI